MRKKPTEYPIMMRCFAVGLVLVLLYIPAIQVFHHHHDTAPTQQSGKSYLSHAAKCPSCAYTSHLEGKQFFTISDPVVSVGFRPAPVLITTFTDCKIFKAFLTGFTNKGPPGLS